MTANGRIALPQVRDGVSLLFVAENVRSQPTGVHARLSLLFGDEIDGDVKLLARDFTNCDRDRDRTHLANAAWKQLPEIARRAWPQNELKHALDLFSAVLWPEYVNAQSGELMEGDPDIGPPKELCGPYVVEGGGTLLYAPPGRGKSYLAMAMAVSLDAGVDLVWPVRERKRSGYINLERSTPSGQYRLAHVNPILGLDPRRPLPFLNARGRSLADVADGVAEMVTKYEIEVLFLDSISRAGLGDLTEGAVANRVIDTLNRLCPTWVAIAHTPRAAEDHIYGSVFFTAGADLEVRLTSHSGERTSGIGLEITKANDLLKPPLAIYALSWGPDGLEAIRPARRHEFPEIEAGRPASLAEEIADFLGQVGAATGTQVADAIGRPRQKVSSTLHNDSLFVVVRKQGPAVYYGLKAIRQGDTSERDTSVTEGGDF